MFKSFLFFIILSLFLSEAEKTTAQNQLPYPIIFVHGLTGSDQTFATTMKFMRDQYNLGDINVFDIVLNADNDNSKALMANDVKWQDFYYGGRYINVGRRNYADDMDNFRDGWTGSNIFAINFKEERIRGAAGTWNDYFDYSDQAGIFKQGYALGIMIKEVLAYTGADKVILVGHSMGGLAIREYLQRTDANGVHVNWVDPYSADGHKVARVATYGTPHLGSNANMDPTKSAVPWETAEANRDLIWEYDSYTHGSGKAQGIYMFGGNEHNIASVWYNSTFDNVDINCNGSENDDIVGINEDFYSYDYNHNMPLPLNIKYTWMTSIFGTFNGITGDGAVNINRQWLHVASTPSPVGLTDTTLQSILHTSEGADYKTIIRGIDEPASLSLAYELKSNSPVLGFITFQQNYAPTDVDAYYIKCSDADALKLYLYGNLSGINRVELYNEYGQMLGYANLTSLPVGFYIDVPYYASKLYFKIIGQASSSTWKNPYTIELVKVYGKSATTGLKKISTNDKITAYSADKQLHIDYQANSVSVLISNSIGQKIIYKENFNPHNTIDLSGLNPGIYLVKITDQNKSFTKKIFVQ